MERLVAAIADDLAAAWSETPATSILSRSSPRFEFSEHR
jgi:hypothetical protein